MLADLALGGRRDLIPGLVWLTYVRNQHGALGLFGDSPPLLIAFSLAIVIAVGFALRATIARSPLAQVGFGAMVGGAAGNVIDRSTHGFVVDFVHVRGLFVFNTADAFVTLGLATIAVTALRER